MSRGKNLFRLEEYRNTLALNGAYYQFKKTYSKKIKPLIDINTDKFWSNKTEVEKENLVKSSIYKDKIKIASSFASKIGGKFLDIGFGNAEIEKILQKYKYIDIYGIDISSRSVSEAKKSLKGAYVKAGILKMPFSNQYFDLVLALDVFEHLPQEKTFKAFNEVSRVLKKNGILVVSMPVNENLEEMLKNQINPNGHLRAYTPAIIKAELLVAGFEILNIYYLYAFKNLYHFKKLISWIWPFKSWSPNLILIRAQKK